MNHFRIVFVCVNLLLAGCYLDTWLTPNPVSRAVPAYRLVVDGTLEMGPLARFTIDKSRIDGGYYSDKAPLSTLVVAPVFALWRLLGLQEYLPAQFETDPAGLARGRRSISMSTARFPVYSVLLLGSFFCGTLPFVALLWLTVSAMGRNGFRPRQAVLAALAFYGSYLYVFSGTYFGHGLAALTLVMAYRHLREARPLRGGIWLGLGILAEYPLAAVLPVWLVQSRWRTGGWHAAVRLAAGVVPAIVVNGAYVFVLTGDPFSLPYAHVDNPAFSAMRHNYGLSWPRPQVLWDLLFSQNYGLLFHVPALLVVGAAACRWAPGRCRELAGGYALGAAGAQLLFFSGYYMWWGGWSHGPRHLIPTAGLLLFAGLPWVEARMRTTWPLAAAGGIGLVCSWLAKSTVGFYMPDGLRWPLIQLVLPQVLQGRFNPNNWLTLAGGLPPATAALVWLWLFAAWLVVLGVWGAVANAAARTGAP